MTAASLPVGLMVLMAPLKGDATPQDSGFVQRKSKGVIVVLDLSGSMSGSPLQQVKNTLNRAMSELPKSAAAGLVTFPDCGASRVNVPLARGSAQQVISAAAGLEAHGGTDITGGLLLAEQEIKRFEKGKACIQVLLLTDGDHNCYGEDPAAIAGRIAESGQKCSQVDAISIGMPAWEAETYDRIVEAGKGSHQTVYDESEMDKAVREALDQFQSEENSRNSGWEGDYSGTRPDGSGDGSGRPRGDNEGQGADPDDGGEGLEQETEEERSSGR